MSEPSGLAAIGLDFKALLFQVVNFAVLLWLLKRFAYKPVVRTLEARRLKIEESLTIAEGLASEKARLAATRARTLSAAEAEAQNIVAKGKQQAATLLAAANTRAQTETERVREQTRQQLAQEHAALKQAVAREAVTLVAHATEKIIDQKLDSAGDAKIIERAIHAAQLRS